MMTVSPQIEYQQRESIKKNQVGILELKSTTKQYENFTRVGQH